MSCARSRSTSTSITSVKNRAGYHFFLLADDRTDVRHTRAMFCKLVRATMITVLCAVLGAGDVYRNCIVMETRIIIN